MGLGVSEVYGLKILGLHQAMCVGMMWKEAGRARVYPELLCELRSVNILSGSQLPM